jgi:hypothetical protein
MMFKGNFVINEYRALLELRVIKAENIPRCKTVTQFSLISVCKGLRYTENRNLEDDCAATLLV